MSVTYIHYGHEKYEESLVTEQVSSLRSKPDKGLWASRTNSRWSWKDWCEREEYRTQALDVYFKFKLTKDANILEIHEEDDIIPYVVQNRDVSVMFSRYMGLKTDICDALDRDKLYNDYNGIEIFFSDNYNEFHNNIFNSWDCDSICIWNPEVIIPL